ncbi:MAG: 4-phosphopantetheinyl transferase family protein, partial [Lentisphaerae bacterium]|nr:4-phosphopantetheinyl transferase family protein [Lentisphaerota bacterium]
AVAANARIGIDIEMLGRALSDDFTRGVFTHEELELAAHTGEAPTAVLRFWCAKEAISKALGTGIRYSPQDLRITAVDAVTGKLQIELLGQWLEPFKQFKGRKNPIHTTLFEGHAVATCLLPASLFETPE